MPVTMREVAQHVGVSIQTVSAVLNGKPGISPATVAKVRQAIADLGYRHNLLASSLRQGYTKSVGLLISAIDNSWLAVFTRGVEDVAQAKGYSLTLCNTYGSPEREVQYLQLLARNQVAGVIAGDDYTMAKEFLQDQPVIFQPMVTTDDVRGGYVATAHLLELGHRRIACVRFANATQTTPTLHRLLGYRAALSQWGVSIDERLIVEGRGYDFDSGLAIVDTLMQQRELPTAIFAQQDLIAIGIIAALRRRGIRVPDDIAVIGYDGLQIAALYNPGLSTVAQPTYEMGVRTMLLLVERIEGVPDSAGETMLDCELCVRESTVAGLTSEWRSGPIASGTPWADWRRDRAGV